MHNSNLESIKTDLRQQARTRATFTNRQITSIAVLLYSIKLYKRIKRNQLFDSIVDTFVSILKADNPRFLEHKFRAIVEFGPFVADATKSRSANQLEPQENAPLTLRSKA